MDKDHELLAARLRDLAARSYKNNIYTSSPFLSISEQEVFHLLRRELEYASPRLFGGKDDCERKLVCFGSAETHGYEEDAPIAVLLVKPLVQKFSDELTHRDFLGAVLNLGIERDAIGDIMVKPGVAAVFALPSVSELICSELTRVKHTSVSVKQVLPEELDGEGFAIEFEELRDSVASLRADCIIAALCNTSRGTAQELCTAGYVALNGRMLEKYDTELKPGDVFTVRGHGKFIFDGESGTSRKGRTRIEARKYK